MIEHDSIRSSGFGDGRAFRTVAFPDEGTQNIFFGLGVIHQFHISLSPSHKFHLDSTLFTLSQAHLFVAAAAATKPAAVTPYLIPMAQSLYRKRPPPDEGGWVCEACGHYASRENEHTRHIRRCTRDQERSSNLWSKSASNIKKLGIVLNGHKRARAGAEDNPTKPVPLRTASMSLQNPPCATEMPRKKWDTYRSMIAQRHIAQRSNTFQSSDFDIITDSSGWPSTMPTLVTDSGHSPLTCSPPTPPPSPLVLPSESTTTPISSADVPASSKRIPKPSRKVQEIREGRAVADELPEGPATLVTTAPPQSTLHISRVILHINEKIRTAINKFGLSREYRRRPTTIPDADTSWKSFIADHSAPPSQAPRRSIADIIFPYPNVSAFIYNKFWKSHLHTSNTAHDEFGDTVLANPHFKPIDALGIDYSAIEKRISEDIQSPWGSNGWRRSTLVLEIPTGIKATKASEREHARVRASAKRHDEVDPDADPYCIHKIPIYDVRTRSLTHLLRETASENPAFKEAHVHGYTETWVPPYKGVPPERVWGELYTSDAFLREERELLASAPEKDCDLPRAVWAYMIWSDSTHLAQFGQAKAWPIYIHDGNISKYARCKPSSRTMHHIGYIPPLPDTLTADLARLGIAATPALLAHCKRELFHGVWRIVLDEEFRQACKHGIVVTCKDGIRRRLYPRIFTYSADYPEKVLIATIRDMGGCPCPRCLVKKECLGNLGTSKDIERIALTRKDDQAFRCKVSDARKLIYKDGYVVNSDAVDKLLKPESLVPTENAFSTFFQDFHFSVFLMLAVDLMHEFELGVWKALLTHLIRMLYSLGPTAVQEFNHRFLQVAPFGQSTIRRFSSNVSELKKLAARDYEDILQCCIPCFEGMFGDHDASIQELLYLASYWHSLAKLRMHTETTLKVLDNVTMLFAKSLRFFAQVTCLKFKTVETDAEYRARCRVAQRRAAMQSGVDSRISGSTPVNIGGKRAKSFNLTTYKLHSLGDYVATIRMFGTTDSYSTQPGELEHRVVKRRYARSNRRGFVDQFVNMDVLETVHERMNEELEEAEATASATAAIELVEPGTDEHDEGDGGALTSTELSEHHRIATDESSKLYLQSWFNQPDNQNEPGYKDFELKLKQHLLARRSHSVTVGDEPSYTAEDLRDVIIKNGIIYPHATASFHYTTYDVRRDHDTINVNGLRRDVMVKANDDPDPTGSRQHPFWYARVLGIYHANVYYGRTAAPEGAEFSRKLDRIGFVPEDDPSGAFGFLDPGQVLRACHLIPAFAYGLTTDLLGPSKMRDSVLKGDWTNYYVSRFVDRDMMMRYLGWGVGHLNSPDFPHEAYDLLASESDRQCDFDLDVQQQGDLTATLPVLEGCETGDAEGKEQMAEMEIADAELELEEDIDDDEIFEY
ncbi:hypothetical protein EVG20_g9986 [Dentipellis fragilis]|uniref:Uncharacterized protein n=1 Tax=Dentipellis fragilis TaxID=205917 RepID=A0A4Y9XX64_9AGAM|nr:hypothetical protein EVG20_g9986 [Dentipellis fragilis]